MYWANSRRITAVQRIYAGFGEREEEEEEAREVGSVGQGSRLLSAEVSSSRLVPVLRAIQKGYSRTNPFPVQLSPKQH